MNKMLLPLLALMLASTQILAQPVIVNEPANQTVIWGGNATFSVMATDVGPLTYQWQLSGTNLPNNIITTVAGNGTQAYSGDGGLAINASLNSPYDVAVDSSGNLFVTDHGNNCIRKVNANGIITTIANIGSPIGVTVDATGTLFIADLLNNCIRKVSTNGIITTVAGNGTHAFSGDGGAATNASLYWPYGVTVDANGNLFIADLFNNRIRTVNTNGIITTVAGNGPSGTGSYSGDGGAASNASLYYPFGVTMDATGKLFIADQYNHRIRKVDTDGMITTVAGNGTNSYSGDSGLATNANLNYPSGVAVDAIGNLFIADEDNQRIREVGTNGIITTFAGNGTWNYSGDGGAATNASLATPTGLAVDSAGNLFIADRYNNRVRKVINTQRSVLALNDVSAVDAGSYQVVVTGVGGSVTSSVVTVNLQLPPITPAFTPGNGTFNFTWSAVSNLTYQLQYSLDLTTTNWTDLGNPITATSNSVSTTDILGSDQQRFYRVQLLP